MARNQGLYRLEKGITKKLNAAELKRKFLFISKDEKVISILGKGFPIFVDNVKIIDNAQLDKYGRIIGASMLIAKISNQQFHLSMRDSCIYIETNVA